MQGKALARGSDCGGPTGAELADNAGYESLTAARIRSAAHVSPKKFTAHDDAEDCYLAALEQHAGAAMAQAARAQPAASSWGGGVYRAIAASPATSPPTSSLPESASPTTFHPTPKAAAPAGA